jgi:hypothetical protein
MMQIQGSVLIVERLAIQCWGSRRIWKFGENPARSRHCVSWDELHCHARVRPCLRRAPSTRVAGTRRRN